MFISNDPTRSGIIEVRASVPGDMNGDGAADADDVAGFVAALADRSAFIAQFPWLQTDYIADFNEDHLITLADVPGFEAACGCDAGLDPMPGDINGDGHVDRMDAAQFIAQFGALGEGVAPRPPTAAACSAISTTTATSARLTLRSSNLTLANPCPSRVHSPIRVQQRSPSLRRSRLRSPR